MEHELVVDEYRASAADLVSLLPRPSRGIRSPRGTDIEWVRTTAISVMVEATHPRSTDRIAVAAERPVFKGVGH